MQKHLPPIALVATILCALMTLVRHQESTIETAPRMRQFNARHHASEQRDIAITASSTTDDVSLQALSPLELDALKRWQETRGYFSEPSDYEAMGEATLRQLAEQGDARAQLLLAMRILGKRSIERGAQSERILVEHFMDARSLLFDASVAGYTSSLISMSSLYLILSQQRDGFDPHSQLLQAHAYAHLAQQRGDWDAATQLQALNATNPLDSADTQRARKVATQLHALLNRHRQTAGLPPLIDGVPDDIEQLQQRFLKTVAEPMIDAIAQPANDRL